MLNKKPSGIYNNHLSQSLGFILVNNGKKAPGPGKEDTPSELTPFEVLENSYQMIRDQSAIDPLEHVYFCSPAFFEKMVVDLLLKMSYGGSRKDAGEAIGRGKGEGFGEMIEEDTLRLDVIYMQAKRWQHPVGRKEIQGFVGSLEGKRARRGIFIITSQFIKNATEYVRFIGKKIILLDGLQLTQFIIDHDVGVTDHNSYTIKLIESDCFTEESVTLLNPRFYLFDPNFYPLTSIPNLMYRPTM